MARYIRNTTQCRWLGSHKKSNSILQVNEGWAYKTFFHLLAETQSWYLSSLPLLDTDPVCSACCARRCLPITTHAFVWNSTCRYITIIMILPQWRAFSSCIFYTHTRGITRINRLASVFMWWILLVSVISICQRQEPIPTISKASYIWHDILAWFIHQWHGIFVPGRGTL